MSDDDPSIVVSGGEGGGVRDHFLGEEMRTSYLTYAMSVIIQRALPDVRDGLKPSQRRVLVAMNDLNLGPRSKFRKCSKITGDTTGNYHPHGDQVVYPTLVRLAQDFNMRYPVVDKQGNFGAVDGSPPAAQRYTEARLSGAAVDMLDDLDKDTVDFVRNYDDTRDEPTVLPGRFPNLLCNGSQGIAVGMATSIPPHNLAEVCDALIALIEDPSLDLADLLEHVKGPDFPTGGIICGRSGILQAYRTGRGQITVRARCEIESFGKDRERIVVTELPYQVNPNNVFEKVKVLVNEKVIEGLSYVNDETDRKAGLRLVFEVKKGYPADVILNQLYRHTQLQNSFSIIMLALQNGRPKTFTLKEMLLAFRDHRREVITRRTRYLKRKAEERLHIVEGLLIAIANIDEVVKVIKESADQAEAQKELTARFLLSPRQADAILAMRLGRLTGLEVHKLEEEKAKLEEAIAYYTKILSDVNEVYALIVEELRDLRVRYPDGRRTEMQEGELEIEDESLIPESEGLVTISHRGYVKRVPMDTYRSQGRGGKGISAGLRDDDFIEYLISANSHDYLLIFTNWGWVHWLKVWRLPELGRGAMGRYLGNYLELREADEARGLPDEQVAGVIPVREFDDRFLVTLTRNGRIKKTPLRDYGRPKKGGIIGVRLNDGDELRRVRLTDGQQDLLVSTSFGQTIRFKESDVREMGRGAAGVIAVKFKSAADHVVDMSIADDEGCLLSISEAGYGLKAKVSDYPCKNRGGLGVVNMSGRDRNGTVVLARILHEEQDLVLISQAGKIVRTPTVDIRLTRRGGKGVRVMSLAEGDRVAAGVLIPSEGPEEEEAPPPEGTEESGAAPMGDPEERPGERDSKGEAPSGEAGDPGERGDEPEAEGVPPEDEE